MTPDADHPSAEAKGRVALIRLSLKLRSKTMNAVKARREYREQVGINHDGMGLDSKRLLTKFKDDLEDELKFLKSGKIQIEEKIGERLGPVTDPDGRQI